MKRKSTIFLQIVIIFIGLFTVAAILHFPRTEGRNAHSTLVQTYLHDPYLAYVYISSIPFFVGLYQAFKLLGYIRQTKAFSLDSVKALRTIKHCALITIAFIVAGRIYIILAFRGKDDVAGPVAMGIVTIFASIVVAVTAGVWEELVQSGAHAQSE